MNSEALLGFLRMGLFIGGCGFIMIFLQPPNSAEWVLSVCSAAIGGLLVLGVVAVNRFTRRS